MRCNARSSNPGRHSFNPLREGSGARKNAGRCHRRLCGGYQRDYRACYSHGGFRRGYDVRLSGGQGTIDSQPCYRRAERHLSSTGFYRHRPTGFETVTEDRLARYIEAGDAFLAANGDPPQQYFGVGDQQFELYDQVDYKANRLVLYPGYLLHSGLVNPARDINSDPATGRLTSNVFVEFR